MKGIWWQGTGRSILTLQSCFKHAQFSVASPSALGLLTPCLVLIWPHSNQFGTLVSGLFEHHILASCHHPCHLLILAPVVHTSLVSLLCLPSVKIPVYQTVSLPLSCTHEAAGQGQLPMPSVKGRTLPWMRAALITSCHYF